MGIFDKPASAQQNSTDKTESIVFAKLPDTLEEFKTLPQAALATPFDTAAMTVVAFCFYPHNKELSLSMLEYLRGPRPLSNMDKQFIADRFRDKDYVPRSYFKGATPDNDYAPFIADSLWNTELGEKLWGKPQRHYEEMLSAGSTAGSTITGALNSLAKEYK